MKIKLFFLGSVFFALLSFSCSENSSGSSIPHPEEPYTLNLNYPMPIITDTVQKTISYIEGTAFCTKKGDDYLFHIEKDTVKQPAYSFSGDTLFFKSYDEANNVITNIFTGNTSSLFGSWNILDDLSKGYWTSAKDIYIQSAQATASIAKNSMAVNITQDNYCYTSEIMGIDIGESTKDFTVISCNEVEKQDKNQTIRIVFNYETNPENSNQYNYSMKVSVGQKSCTHQKGRILWTEDLCIKSYMDLVIEELGTESSMETDGSYNNGSVFLTCLEDLGVDPNLL